MVELRPKVIDALQQVFDPEIPVNIYELGLVYDVLVDADRKVGVRMTLTAPACPAAQTLPGEVRDRARGVEGVTARPGGDRLRPAVDDGADDRRRAAAARPPLSPACSKLGMRADARDARPFRRATSRSTAQAWAKLRDSTPLTLERARPARPARPERRAVAGRGRADLPAAVAAAQPPRPRHPGAAPRLAARSSATPPPRCRSSSAWPAASRSARAPPRASSRRCCRAGRGIPSVDLVTTDGFLFPNAVLNAPRHHAAARASPRATTAPGWCASWPT